MQKVAKGGMEAYIILTFFGRSFLWWVNFFLNMDTTTYSKDLRKYV